ncbi:MAG: hypothetical protein ACTTJ7_07865 [Treponema sp.]
MELKLKIISICASIVIFAASCNQAKNPTTEIPSNDNGSGSTSQQGGGSSGGGSSGGGSGAQQNQGGQQNQNNQQNDQPNQGAISYDSNPKSVSNYTLNFAEGMEKTYRLQNM